MKHRAILGCGYIGSALARLWKKRKVPTTLTTQSPHKLPSLTEIAHKSVLFRSSDLDTLALLLQENDTLVVTIAASSPHTYFEAYLQTAQVLRKTALAMNTPRHLLYTSTTSVYGDHGGKWVEETSPLLATSENGKILIETEKTYESLREIGWQVTLFRLGEIYGPGRELSKKVEHLLQHPLPGKGDTYTNMVHQADVAAAIDFAVEQRLEGIFNLVDDDHMTRKELYQTISHAFRLPPVEWDPSLPSLHSSNKRASNHLLKKEGFTFSHPHREIA